MKCSWIIATTSSISLILIARATPSLRRGCNAMWLCTAAKTSKLLSVRWKRRFQPEPPKSQKNHARVDGRSETASLAEAFREQA